MLRSNTRAAKDIRHRPMLAVLLALQMLLSVLTVACQDEAKILPASSPASDIAQPIGTPEATATAEASASPSARLDEEARRILERAQDSMSALTTYHASLNMRRWQTGSEDLETSIEMDVEQPDRAYAVVTSPDVADFEMMFEGVKAYVRLPGKEWQTTEEALGLSVEELGFSRPDRWADLELLRLAETVDMLGEDEVGGVSVYHLRGSMSAEEAFAAASEIWDAGGPLRDFLESAEGGTLSLDHYIGRSDFLVRRAKMKLTTAVMGAALESEADIVYSAFNEPVEIPEIE